MRRCPTCQRGYADATEFCLDDGEALVTLEARNVADLIGAQHAPARVHALLRAAALALQGFDLSRLQGALYPEDLELVGDDLDAPRLVVAVDLEARTRDDAAGLARRAAVQTPEALRGERGGSDEAAAVYGLGCLGFALAEGAFAFDGASPAAMRVRKLLEAPPRSERAGALAELLAAAMASDPAARPALARFGDDLPAPAPSLSPAPAAAPALASARPSAPQSLGAPVAAPARSSSRLGVAAIALGGAVAALSVVAAGVLSLSSRSNDAPSSAASRAVPPSPVAPGAPSPVAPGAPSPVAPVPLPAEVAAAPAPEPTPAPEVEAAPAPVAMSRPRAPSAARRPSRRTSSSSGAGARAAPPSAPGAGLGLGRVGAGGGGDTSRGGLDELLDSATASEQSRRAAVRRPRAAVRSPVASTAVRTARPPPAAEPRPAPPPPGAIARPASAAAPPPRVATPTTGAPTTGEGAPPPRADAPSPPEDAAPVAPPPPAARSLPPRARSLLPWVLIGSGTLLGAILGALGVLVVLRRRRAPAAAPALAPERTLPRDLPAPEAFAQTVAAPPTPPPGSLRCVSCSQVVPAAARFCPYDGAPVTQASAPSAEHRGTPLPQRFCVGPYECIEPIGEGGMGVVYRARHLHIDRVAAVKVLLPGAGLDPNRVELFRREARLAASVQHKNSVQIYDFGELQGSMLYLAMELVEGESLDRILHGRPMDPARVARIVLQIGDALDAAHRAGVVHRDLKPANVMVCDVGRSDTVKIVDFGIARGVMDPRRTEAGRVMGTLGYMAPEQARGDADLDARADVFALGVVAYEMLTGALPFDDAASGFHVALMRRMALQDPPPPARARVPSLSPAVDECLNAAMDSLRIRRTATAGAFARSLAAAIGGASGYASMRVG